MLKTAAPRPGTLRDERTSNCYVCGPAHPTGLRIAFQMNDDRSVAATWTAAHRWEGFPGIIHGGIVSTILDEAMSQAVSAAGCHALTAELRVRLRSPLQPGDKVSIQGWVVDRRKRRIQTEAVMTSPDGQEYAHAWGTFLTVDR